MIDEIFPGGSVDSHTTFPSFLLAYHGCDREVGEFVLSGETDLEPSTNKFDWLGNGIYFWENNLSRARRWADDLKAQSRIETPFVVGAVLDLGYCLDLLQSGHLNIVQAGYLALEKSAREE